MRGHWVFLLLFLSACGKGPAPPSPPAERTPAPAPPAHLTLLFPGEDLLLHREVREVPELPATLEGRMRLVVEELLAGPRGSLSPICSYPARLEAVFYNGHGTAFVALSSPGEGLGGTAAEFLLLYAVTNSLALNFREVERVQLLFGGQEVETLGHVDFSRPVAPRWELVAP